MKMNDICNSHMRNKVPTSNPSHVPLMISTKALFAGMCVYESICLIFTFWIQIRHTFLVCCLPIFCCYFDIGMCCCSCCGSVFVLLVVSFLKIFVQFFTLYSISHIFILVLCVCALMCDALTERGWSIFLHVALYFSIEKHTILDIEMMFISNYFVVYNSEYE